jgi:hypothetical protein
MVAMFTASAFADDKICEIDGKEAINFARENGFNFSIKASEGEGECQAGGKKPWFMANAAADGKLVCEVHLFMGRILQQDWHYKNVEFSGSKLAKQSNPEVGANSAAIRFQLIAQKLQSEQTVLQTLVLTGPDCDNWQDAFQLSKPLPDKDNKTKAPEEENIPD